MSDLNFQIDGVAQTGARFAAKARKFSIIIDEPPVLGGDDLGANPVEYLLAGYAGCLNVVAHLTAKELGINIEKLSIKVDGNLNPARLLGQSYDERAGFKHIHVHFSPKTDASPGQLKTWIAAITKRCPVNDNLANGTPLSFNLIHEKATGPVVIL